MAKKKKTDYSKFGPKKGSYGPQKGYAVDVSKEADYSKFGPKKYPPSPYSDEGWETATGPPMGSSGDALSAGGMVSGLRQAPQGGGMLPAPGDPPPVKSLLEELQSDTALALEYAEMSEAAGEEFDGATYDLQRRFLKEAKADADANLADIYAKWQPTLQAMAKDTPYGLGGMFTEGAQKQHEGTQFWGQQKMLTEVQGVDQAEQIARVQHAQAQRAARSSASTELEDKLKSVNEKKIEGYYLDLQQDGVKNPRKEVERILREYHGMNEYEAKAWAASLDPTAKEATGGRRKEPNILETLGDGGAAYVARRKAGKGGSMQPSDGWFEDRADSYIDKWASESLSLAEMGHTSKKNFIAWLKNDFNTRVNKKAGKKNTDMSRFGPPR